MGGTEFSMRVAEGMRAASGSISSGVVTEHGHLQMSEDDIIVFEVTQFGIPEAMDVGEGFLATSNGVSSAAIAHTQPLRRMVMTVPPDGALSERRHIVS